jgi:hypothetical protein
LTKRQFFSKIVCLFGSAMVNKLERLLDSKFIKWRKIEHHFYAMNSVSIVFFEVKKVMAVGKRKLDVIVQVFVECAVMSNLNDQCKAIIRDYSIGNDLNIYHKC